MKYAVKEYAATAVDIIARRLRLSFLNVQAAEESLPVIVQIMGDELGWDKRERERQTEEATTFLRMQMGKDVNKASQDNIPVSLTKAEIAEYVKRFNALDDGKKGYISINDIRKSLKVGPQKMFFLFNYFFSFKLLFDIKKEGVKLSDEDLSSLLYRISLKTHGVLEMPEYLQVCNNVDISETRRGHYRRASA